MCMDLEDFYFGEQTDFSHICKSELTERVEEPVFSIMMAVYNDTSLLNSAISSCLRQNFSSWELLILDNSDKNDEPWRMMQNAMAYDGRICGFRSEKNVGWAKGSQQLLQRARGEYVTFLSADDCLVPGALLRVNEEVRKHHPDVVFVGNMYTNYLGGHEVENLGGILPDYRVYAGGSRSEALAELMKNVYYNSMFHYEKRAFMQEHGMDFFEPYYGDCATMTYAITKAEKIVVLDMPAYCLTKNTSQSTGYYGVLSEDYISISQWRSAKALFEQEQFFDRATVYYVADRIFQNYVASLKALCIGRWRDKYMNPVEHMMLDDIIRELARNLESDGVGELFILMGSRGFKALISNVANIKMFPGEEIEASARGSWIYPFICLVLGRRKLSFLEELNLICNFILKKENTWCIGIYAFQELADRCGDDELNLFRDKLEKVLAKYSQLVSQNSGTWLMRMIE